MRRGRRGVRGGGGDEETWIYPVLLSLGRILAGRELPLGAGLLLILLQYKTLLK